MSFKIDNITPFANNAKRGKVPVLWNYYNGDDDTVTTAGYIPYSSEFSNGDQVLVIKKITQVSPGIMFLLQARL